MPSEELEKSLRAQVDDYIDSRLSGLREEIARLQSQFNEAFTRLLERSQGETQSDTSVAVAVSEHLRAAHEKGLEDAAAESARTKTSSDMAILKAAIDEIDNQRSQSDILSSLVNRAASYAPRVLFFLIKGEQAVGWRGRGLEGSIGDEAVRNIALPLTADTPLKGVYETRASASVEPGTYGEDHLLLEKLGSEPPVRMVSVPLVVRDKTVAVLYADSAQLDSEAINLEAIETLVRVAGMAVELLAISRSAPVERPARFEPAPAAKPQPAPHVAADTADMHEAQNADGEGSNATTPLPQEEPGMASPANFASQPAESATPPTAAAPPDVPAETFNAPLGTKRRYGSADAELPVEVNDDEKRLHNDARRFARLLVSEIKLYNEQKVKDGRAESNIYSRLREDIDRSREMYDKRVAPPVAARYDYFHQELVNTLAEGDADKLGQDYPGATVNA
ncbi:MAG: hypothetical protein ABR577_15735 [Pyrinomonadaceae bacterium]